MAHVDENHRHHHRGGKHTAILHTVPQSDLITQQLPETPVVVESAEVSG